MIRCAVWAALALSVLALSPLLVAIVVVGDLWYTLCGAERIP